MKTSIIPIFIPHIGCPHRCVFCNQWQITGHVGLPSPADVADLIHTYTSSCREKRHWEVAFYGGSFTAIDGALQDSLLTPAAEALEQGVIQAIRCSTRPDAIDDAILDRLERFGLTTVELGVQSMDDGVLKAAKRGHTAAQVVDATQLLKQRGFTVGHQLMPGLPGEDWPSLMATTAAICALQPHVARIYPVVVLKDTELAEMYAHGAYKALTVEEGIRRSAYMKRTFLAAHIRVIRTGLQATDGLDDPTQVLAGAYTPAMGERVDAALYRERLFAALDTVTDDDIVIAYNRRDTSRLRGYKNETVHLAEKRYAGRTLIWREDNSLPIHTISIGPTLIFI